MPSGTFHSEHSRAVLQQGGQLRSQDNTQYTVGRSGAFQKPGLARPEGDRKRSSSSEFRPQAGTGDELIS